MPKMWEELSIFNNAHRFLLKNCSTGWLSDWQMEKKPENLTPGYIFFKVHQQYGPHQDRSQGFEFCSCLTDLHAAAVNKPNNGLSVCLSGWEIREVFCIKITKFCFRSLPGFLSLGYCNIKLTSVFYLPLYL